MSSESRVYCAPSLIFAPKLETTGRLWYVKSINHNIVQSTLPLRVGLRYQRPVVQTITNLITSKLQLTEALFSSILKNSKFFKQLCEGLRQLKYIDRVSNACKKSSTLLLAAVWSVRWFRAQTKGNWSPGFKKSFSQILGKRNLKRG